MVAPFVIDGPMNGTIFLAYVSSNNVWLRRSAAETSSSWTTFRLIRSPV
jgi:hypothetical protein